MHCPERDFDNFFLHMCPSSYARGVEMDRTGLVSLILGVLLLIAGGYGVYVFLPYVIDFVLGVIGILGIVIGIFLVLFGILMIKD